MSKEYFIIYEKVVQGSYGRMDRQEKRRIMPASSATDAWKKIQEDESEFNGLNLIDIRRI
jgi:hypothetical protein